MHGILRMAPKELIYQRRQFYEGQRLNGVYCSVNSLNKVNQNESTHDIYGDVQESTAYTESTTLYTYITFDVHPTIKTLKSLGWYVDTETFPVIAYIPMIYKDIDGNWSDYKPQLDDKITIMSNSTLQLDLLNDEESLLVRKLVGQGFPDVVYWTVNLVPLRRNV